MTNPSVPLSEELFKRLDGWLQKMVNLQRDKVLRLARDIDPRVTADDVLNPHDIPGLVADSTFNFEDGHLAGLISAQIALRAEYRRFMEEREGKA